MRGLLLLKVVPPGLVEQGKGNLEEERWTMEVVVGERIELEEAIGLIRYN